MDSETILDSEAENWDVGSQNDQVRNNFVIPMLSSQLNQFSPKTILDIGAATGYVARTVDRFLDIRPDWTLLDRDANRLSYSTAQQPEDMQATAVLGDLFDFNDLDQQFDAIILSFTLLELQWNQRLFKRLKSICAMNGRLLIVLPDIWRDILCSSKNSSYNANKFLNEAVEIKKTDKFTGKQYPFIAQRLEVLLAGLTEQGFSLVHFEIGKIDQSSVFMLTFKNG